MPGPAPAHRPRFPEDFLQRARATLRRKTAPHCLVQRARLALLLEQAPHLGHAEAGDAVALSAPQVRRWRRRWAAGDFALDDLPGRGRKAHFSPLDKAVVKAIACEAVFEDELPLSRLSLADLTARAGRALGQPISRSTVWRILDADAIKPWQYEHWIFPRDPQFAAKARVILDLYAGLWQDERLDTEDRIISADEKTSIQARVRRHATLGPAPGRRRRVEPEYERGGALQYLAAWDVQEGLVMGRCEATTGIVPFGRLVAQVMERPGYRGASRVFWVVDNGSSHRGEAAQRRLVQAYPNAILVHTPVHASWLNQVEIYFSLVQRKVLTPNDFADLAAVEQRLRLYEELTNRSPRPFEWRFDRTKLKAFLKRLAAHEAVGPAARPSA
jgi:DDE superfamily endonuclease/Homeodomain-like domain